MAHDRIVNQHQSGLALYPRNLSYDLLPLIGPSGWSLLRALHDHADEQALTYRGTRPIAPSSEEMQALAGVGEASLLVIKELLHICGCLSWEEIRGKQEPRPGRQLKQQPTRSVVYYLHPLTGLAITLPLVQRIMHYAQRSERAQAYLKANGLFRPQPAFLPTSVWPALLVSLIEQSDWRALFDHIHGPTKHEQYRVAALRWVNSAAQIVATLELEQQGYQSPATTSVADRTITVKARWQQKETVSSSWVHGPFERSQGDSSPIPHTPFNELINQSSNKQIPLAAWEGGTPQGRSVQGTGNGSVSPERGNGAVMAKPEGRRADAGVEADRPAEAGDACPPKLSPCLPPPESNPESRRIKQDRVPADAESQNTVPAEVALWAVVADILLRTGLTPSSVASAVPPYVPTPSEQRQARRLLRRYAHGEIGAALEVAVRGYIPGPGQPPSIVRFGFAAGLPMFRAALARPIPLTPAFAPDSADRAVDDPSHRPGPADEQEQIAADFWHEYERLTGRRPTRAERRRIDVVAKEVEYHRLLVWLDRWERAHAGTASPLTPGYFEACADARVPEHAPRPAKPSPPAPSPVSPGPVPVSHEQGLPEVYERLVALNVKKARALAQLPATTCKLVDAWALASQDPSIKNRSAYIAAGVTSGKLPNLRPSTAVSNAQVIDITRMPTGHSDVLPTSELWITCLEQMKAHLPANEWETWLCPCSIAQLDANGVVIAAPNIFVRQELEQRYRPLLQRVLLEVTGWHVDLLFVIDTGRSHPAYS